MKSINIGLFKNSNNDYNKEYINHILNKCNSLITISHSEYESDKLNRIILKGEPIKAIFKSKISSKTEEIKICFLEFDLDLFYKSIETIVDITFDNVKELSVEPFDNTDVAKSEVVSLIKNVLIKYSYNEPKNLIYLISDIFKNVLTSHKLRNGNKRMSSMLLANMLYQQGIFLRGSVKYKFRDFWRKNEKKFIKFIQEYDSIYLSSDFNEKDNNLLLKIYKWIYDSTYISLNFN